MCADILILLLWCPGTLAAGGPSLPYSLRPSLPYRPRLAEGA